MDALEILQTLVKRWWVVIPVMVLAVGGALYLGDQQPTEYKRTMYATVLGPAELETDTPQRSNPFRALGLDTTAQTLAISGEGSPARAAARAAGVSTAYELTTTRNNPIITISATGASPQQVVDTLTFVSTYVSDDLQKSQDDVGAPSTSRLTLKILDPASGPVQASSGATRIRIAVIAAGVLLAILLAVIVDRIITSRRAARLVQDRGPGQRSTTVVARRTAVAAGEAAPGAAAINGSVRTTGMDPRARRGNDDLVESSGSVVQVAGASAGPRTPGGAAVSDDAQARRARPQPAP